jgi:hypothetical protein
MHIHFVCPTKKNELGWGFPWGGRDWAQAPWPAMRARRRGKRGGVARRGEEGYAGCGGRKGAIGWLHGRGSVPTVILCV